MKKVSPSRTRERTAQRRISRVLIVNAIGVLVAIPALMYSFYLESPATIVQGAARLMASAEISLTAAIPENPYNTLAGQLSAEQTRLDTRQTALNARESALNKKGLFGIDWGFISACISVFLLILVALNFYFDMRRSKGRRDPLTRKFLVDLRS